MIVLKYVLMFTVTADKLEHFLAMSTCTAYSILWKFYPRVVSLSSATLTTLALPSRVICMRLLYFLRKQFPCFPIYSDIFFRFCERVVIETLLMHYV